MTSRIDRSCEILGRLLHERAYQTLRDTLQKLELSRMAQERANELRLYQVSDSGAGFDKGAPRARGSQLYGLFPSLYL